jgi:hypothetical protein
VAARVQKAAVSDAVSGPGRVDASGRLGHSLRRRPRWQALVASKCLRELRARALNVTPGVRSFRAWRAQDDPSLVMVEETLDTREQAQAV